MKAVKEQTEYKLTDLEEQLMEMQEALDRFREPMGGAPDREELLKVSARRRTHLDQPKGLSSPTVLFI